MNSQKALLFAGAFLAMSFQLNAAVVCYDSHATGTGDGTSWANAFTDLQAAVNAAGNGGEVRVRQGVHEPQTVSTANAISLLSVRLVGGYTGNGDERSTDRALTIFNGDLGHNDYYVDAMGTKVGDLFNSETGKLLEFRDPTPEERYWEKKSSGDNVRKLFATSADASPTDRLWIEGITFAGFGGGTALGANTGTLYMGSTAVYFTMTNCDFIGTHLGGANGAGAIQIANDSTIADCCFLGFGGAQICCGIKPAATGNGAEIRNCTFHSSYSYYANQRSACLSLYGGNATQQTGMRVIGCSFSHITGGDTTAAPSGGYGLVIGGATGNDKILEVTDCVFRDIHLLNMKVGMINVGYDCPFTDCVISNCVVDDPICPGDGALCYGGVFSGGALIGNRAFIANQDAPLSAAVKLFSYKSVSNVEIADNLLVAHTTGMATLLASQDGGDETGKNITGNVVSNLVGDAALISKVSNLKDMRIEGNEAYAAGATVKVVGEIRTSCRNTSIYNNVAAGGTERSCIIDACSLSFANVVVAKNRHVDFGPDCMTCLVRKSGNAEGSFFAWSTFYDNDAKVQFYNTTTRTGTIRLHFFSSVVWRRGDPDSFVIVQDEYTDKWPKASGGVIVHNSYVKGFDETHPCYYSDATFPSRTCYTEEPVFCDRVHRTADGRAYFVMSRACAYKKLFGAKPWMLTEAGKSTFGRGNPGDLVFYDPKAYYYDFANMGWTAATLVGYRPSLYGSEVPFADFRGNERPEGKVILGAVQEMEPTGLAVIVR